MEQLNYTDLVTALGWLFVQVTFTDLTGLVLLILSGVQFKRVEAITRSQTLMDVRAPQGGMTLAEQAELYPVNMASVSQRSSAKDRYSNHILFTNPFI